MSFSCSDSFNSLEQNGNGACHHSPPGQTVAELEFQGLTVLTFLQSSLVQSMALSHKDISPVSQYEGLQVTVEYVETRERWTSDELLAKQQTKGRGSRGTCHNHVETRHQTHLQCYRSRHRDTAAVCNGNITRSVLHPSVFIVGSSGLLQTFELL